MTDCNKIQANNLACNKISLTDKWKKGELPNGWYYVRLIRGEYRIDLYINSKNEWIDCPDNIIDTVVCKVPSCEEWQKHRKTLLKTQEKNCDLEIINAQLKERLKNTQELELEVRRENAKLKDETEELRRENRELKKLRDNWYKSFEAKSKGLFETMKDCQTLAQKLLQVKPELREWLEINYKEYL